MKQPIIYTLLFSLALLSCEQRTDPDGQFGILRGSIGIYEGNCMPGPGSSECKHSPLATTVAITIPSEHFNLDLLVDSVLSSPDGTFEIDLPAGSYSLFLRDGNEFVCDTWTCPDGCFCELLTIRADSVTMVEANVDHAYW